VPGSFLIKALWEIKPKREGNRMTSSITEREVAADICQELNQYINQGGTPFDKTSVEHHADSRYPDITVWTNYQNQKAFSFWELKAPGLQEDLSVLPAKAEMLDARYVVVWNFQSGSLFEVENGELKELKSYPIPLMGSLEEWSNRKNEFQWSTKRRRY
jgi:hypothetical protein